MISFLVRDKNWNNYDPKILNYEENFDTSLEYIFDLEYGIDEILKTRNVILFSDNSITLSSEGEFLTDFWTNRIGFNLLIPLYDKSNYFILEKRFTTSIIILRKKKISGRFFFFTFVYFFRFVKYHMLLVCNGNCISFFGFWKNIWLLF